jgi:lysophospholipase L1-like esterase
MNKIVLIIIIMALPVKLFSISAILSDKTSLIDNSGKKSAKTIKIFAIGDSNGALSQGWISQLKKIRPNDTIYKISISGNTIGFNNSGNRNLNTLSNIGSYMEKAYSKLGEIDMIIIMLGTNDCKSVFKDSLSIVPENMRKLIMGIKQNARLHKDKPTIFIVSPPPFGQDEKLEEKYKGGMGRVTLLNEQLLRIASEENVEFINTCQILQPVFKYLSADGVHLNPEGQMMIALIIQENLKFFQQSR